MKRIGILSDTHCCTDPRIAKHFAEVDEIWHAGDIGDVDTYKWLSGIAPVFRAVAGNIDGAMVRRVCPELLVFETEGAKVVMTHIGGYPGKYSPGILQILRSERPKIFVSGHSHLLKVMPDPELDLLHINPGAAGVHGWQKVRTLVRLAIDAGIPKELEVIHLSPQRNF